MDLTVKPMEFGTRVGGTAAMVGNQLVGVRYGVQRKNDVVGDHRTGLETRSSVQSRSSRGQIVYNQFGNVPPLISEFAPVRIERSRAEFNKSFSHMSGLERTRASGGAALGDLDAAVNTVRVAQKAKTKANQRAKGRREGAITKEREIITNLAKNFKNVAMPDTQKWKIIYDKGLGTERIELKDTANDIAASLAATVGAFKAKKIDEIRLLKRGATQPQLISVPPADFFKANPKGFASISIERPIEPEDVIV